MIRILFAFLFLCSTVFAQVDIGAGLGLNFYNQSSFRDYINTFYSTPSNELGVFNTAAEFFVNGEYQLSEKIDLGLDYNILIFSFSSSSIGNYNYSTEYEIHRPSVLVYYVMRGEGYKFKFGGGLGPRFLFLSETQLQENKYTSTGIGVVLKAKGMTALSEKLFALIEGSIILDLAGEPTTSEGEKLFNSISNKNIYINNLGFGLRLGAVYSF